MNKQQWQDKYQLELESAYAKTRIDEYSDYSEFESEQWKAYQDSVNEARINEWENSGD